MEAVIFAPFMFSAVAVLLVGYWNPVQLRAKSGAIMEEYTDYRWLAVAAVLGGLVGVFIVAMVNKKMGVRSPKSFF